MKKWQIYGLSMLLVLLSGCNNDDNNETNLDEKVLSLAQKHLQTGNPAEGREIPSVEDPKVHLGKKLFFSKHLSLEMDTACVSCHHPYLGGGDALSLPIGVEAVDPDLVGPGREHKDTGYSYYDGGPTVPRNAPSTFNMALFDATQFWDARIESITPIEGENGSKGGILIPDTSDYERIIWEPEDTANLPSAQANFPIISPQEMRSFHHEELTSKSDVREYLVNRLRGSEGNEDLNETAVEAWLQAFREGFQDPDGDAETLITRKNITDAIGEYERSQLFVNNAWNRYLNGETDAISEKAKKGAILFFTDYEGGGANCIACHSGDLFSDEKTHVMAVPQIGRGKNYDGTTEDYGRSNITLNEEDTYKFRTPSLLNVEVTGPWGHDGAFVTLEAMVRHMLKPETAENYDTGSLTQKGISVQCKETDINTRHALEKLQQNRELGISPHRSVDFDDRQVEQIVEFLKTLTDPCVKEKSCLDRWMPDYTTQDAKLLDLLNAKFSENIFD